MEHEYLAGLYLLEETYEDDKRVWNRPSLEGVVTPPRESRRWTGVTKSTHGLIPSTSS